MNFAATRMPNTAVSARGVSAALAEQQARRAQYADRVAGGQASNAVRAPAPAPAHVCVRASLHQRTTHHQPLVATAEIEAQKLAREERKETTNAVKSVLIQVPHSQRAHAGSVQAVCAEPATIH